jgi:hypothetical protein
MSHPVREFERVNAVIPVHIEGGGEGETRNLSAQGLFFVTDKPFETGHQLRFTIEFGSAAGTFHLDCLAEITRVDSLEGKIGVGARIIESRLERRTGPAGAALPQAGNEETERALRL